MWNIMKINLCLIILTSLISLSCSSEHPQPEQLDQILSDLTSQRRTLEQVIDEANKKIEKADKEISKASVNTLELKSARNDKMYAEAKREKARQMIEYLNIRESQRSYQVRTEYKKAHFNKLEYDKSDEFKAYKQNRKLNSVSLIWDNRVPRSNTQQTTNELKEKNE